MVTERVVILEGDLLPKLSQRRLASRLGEAEGLLALLLDYGGASAKGNARPSFPASYLSQDRVRRSRAVKGLTAIKWVETVKSPAYERHWRGQWGRRGSDVKIGHPPTRIKLSSIVLPWNPYTLFAKAGFETSKRRLELGQALVRAGLVRRWGLADLKLKADFAESHPELMEIVVRQLARVAGGQDRDLREFFDAGVKKLKGPLDVPSKARAFAESQEFAFLAVMKYSRLFHDWRTESARDFVRQLAILSVQARFELEGIHKSTQEAIEWGIRGRSGR